MEQENKRGAGRPPLSPEEKRKLKSFRLPPQTIRDLGILSSLLSKDETATVEFAIKEALEKRTTL